MIVSSLQNSAADIARLWTAGLDSPSMHWANVVNLSEILTMLDDNEWVRNQTPSNMFIILYTLSIHPCFVHFPI